MFTVNVNIYDHRGDGLVERIAATLDSIQAQLKSVITTEQTMAATIDDLLNDVNEEATVIDGVKTLLDGLSKQLADAIAANDPAKIQQVKDAIDANKNALASAVAANTPLGAPQSAAERNRAAGTGPDRSNKVDEAAHHRRV
jgi:uncharacterized protein YoxC